MKVLIKTLLKNSNEIVENTLSAIKKDNKIVYNDTCLTKVDFTGIITRENDEFYLKLDLINNECYYVLKGFGATNIDVYVLHYKVSNNYFEVEYKIMEEKILYYIEVLNDN